MLARVSLGLVAALTVSIFLPKLAHAQAKAPAALTVPGEAKKLESAFSAAADRAALSLVLLEIQVREENEGRSARLVTRQGDSPLARSFATGVVLSADGTLVTNNSLIEDALAIRVRLPDGRMLPAKLLGRDIVTDVAVLKIEATGLAPIRPLETEPRTGQWVVVVGAPNGAGPTVTTGTVSTRSSKQLVSAGIEDLAVITAPVLGANAGGPACDLEGRMIGLASTTVGNAGIGTSASAVVPSSLLKRVVEQIVKTGRVERASLGVSVQDATGDVATMLKIDPPTGALINAVTEGGPAAKSNLKPGDVIVAVAGKPVRDAQELAREVLSKPLNQPLALEVAREGKRYSASVTVGPRKEAPLPPVPVQQQGVPQVGLGFNVRDLTVQESTQRGLPAKALPLVTVVAPGSAADRAGLKVGDVIVEADGAVEGNTQQLVQASADGQVLVRVRRREAAFYAALKK